MAKTKVFWTPEEFERVALAYVRISRAKRQTARRSVIEAMDKELPVGRHKALNSAGSLLARMTPYLKAAEETIDAQAQADRLAKLEPQAPPPEALPAESPAEPPAEPQSAEPVGVEDAIVAAIKRVLMRVINDSDLRAALLHALGTHHDDDEPAPDLPAPAMAIATVPSKLPRVLVLGALGPQLTELRHAFEGRAILKFWTTDQRHQAIKPLAGWCTFAVAFVGFMSHAAVHKVREASKAEIGGFPLLLNSNGVSSAKDLIERRLASMAAQKP